MECMAKIADGLYWVGGNDRRLNLFENAFPVPRGVSYNAYVSLDEKTVLIDTADRAVAEQFFENVDAALSGRTLDYIVVNHMEPDHAATLMDACRRYPNATVVVNQKAAAMIRQFFGAEPQGRLRVVNEGDELVTGARRFTFVFAPMVHWPEVMVTYEHTTKTLFSADAFGTFGALSGCLFADEADFERDWLPDARRYYANIVGKYGAPVRALLQKAAGLEIAMLCPLHGPVWRKDIAWFVDKYQKWSAYEPEEDGVLIACASIYGHTMNAAEKLAMALRDAGARNVALYDLSVTDLSYVLADAFRYGRWALLASTYNAGVFTPMEHFLLDAKAHALQNRRVALVENGSWAPVAGKLMRDALSSMKNIEIVEPVVTVKSALAPGQDEQLGALAAALLA